jgi:hypothetical protein
MAAMLLAIGIAVVATLEPAQAAFPGQNGKISFVRNGNIHTMKPNGSAKTKLTNTPESNESSPNFSADGTKIAYVRSEDPCSYPCSYPCSDIYTMRADGSHQVRRTKTSEWECGPLPPGRPTDRG